MPPPIYGVNSASAAHFLLAGVSDAGRALSEGDACGRPCGAETCGFFNATQSCQDLERFGCSCSGCCSIEEEPIGAGGVVLIFFASMWGLFMFCHCYYRIFAIREAREETGYHVEELLPLRSIISAPGLMTEKVHCYAAIVDETMRVGSGGGLDEEHEDIELVFLSFDEAMAMVENGALSDAKTVVMLQWAALNRHVFGL